MAKYPVTQRLESIANLLRELKRFAPAHDVNITQAIYDLEGIAKDFDQRIDIHIAERPLINNAAQHSVQRTCANCRADNWVTAGFPVSKEYCGNCGASR